MCELTDRLNRKWFWLAILAIALAVWGLTDIRSRAKSDPKNLPGHRTDLTVYTTAGAAMFDGRDPYAVHNPRGWHYLYPPLFAILMSPLSLLNSQWQGVIWYAISVATAWGCFTESRRLWRWLNSTSADKSSPSTAATPTYIFWLAGATILFPALNCLQRGQVGILLTYLLLFGLRCVLTGKNRWSALAGGIVLALPFSIKIIPALPVGVLCLLLLAVAGLHRWNQLATRRALGMCAGVVAGLLLYILVIPSAIIGPAANAKHLSTWLTVMADKQGQSDDDFSVHTKRNQSFMNGLYRLGNWTAYKYGHAPDDRIIDADSDDTPPQNVPMLMDSYWQSLAVRLVQLGLLAILFAAGWTAARENNSWTIVAVFALACLSISTVSPVFRGHYYVLWLPAAWIVPLYQWQLGRARMAMTLAISACALVLIHYVFLNNAGRVGILGIGATVWYLVATVSVLRVKQAARQEFVQTRGQLLQAA